MKFIMMVITLLLLCDISIAQSQVANWYPMGKNNATTVYATASECKKVEGQDCTNIAGKILQIHDLQDIQVDDYTKPVYSAKYKVVACDDEADCSSKTSSYTQDFLKPLAERYCDGDERDILQFGPNELMPGYSYWCWKQESWEKKTVKRMVENPAKKSQYESDQAAKIADDAALGAAKERMRQGNEVIALISVLNASKNLTSAQLKTMLATYATIKGLLETGALGSAKDDILAITPDATIVTQDDKDKLIAKLDEYLGN